MYNYHPKFCYGTHTTREQKVYFLYHGFKYFPLIPCFRLIHIFRVLEYSVYSAFQNITIEFMFAGINMFWARLRLILI